MNKFVQDYHFSAADRRKTNIMVIQCNFQNSALKRMTVRKRLLFRASHGE